MNIKHDKIVVGSSLKAVMFAYVNELPIFFSVPQKPFFFNKLPVHLDLSFLSIVNKVTKLNGIKSEKEVGLPQEILWNKLMFILSYVGKAPLADFCDSMRYNGETLVFSNFFSKISEVSFNTCYYFGDNNCYRLIDQKEIDKAFMQAKKTGYALVGFASHDFRDLEYEVKYLDNLIKKSHKKFRNVEYKFSESKHAFSQIAKLKEKIKIKPIKFKIKYYKKTKKDFARISVRVTQGDVFGPQPFLAIKTKKGRYINDNFDFSSNKKVWHYAFHSDTIPIKDISTIGIAANDKLGNTCIKKIQFNKSRINIR